MNVVCEDIQPEIELLQAESPGSSPKSIMSPEDIMRAVDKTLLDVETNILRERLKILTVQKSKLESKICLPRRPSIQICGWGSGWAVQCSTWGATAHICLWEKSSFWMVVKKEALFVYIAVIRFLSRGNCLSRYSNYLILLWLCFY